MGLPEADIPFELLQDPYGIRFWPEFKGRDGCRTPVPWNKNQSNAGFSTATPWLPVPEAHYPRSADVMENDPDSLLHFFREFLGWRKQHPALVRGNQRFITAKENVIALEREHGGQRIGIVCNFTHQAAETCIPEWQNSTLLESPANNGSADKGNMSLPAYGVVILSL